jgi:hypothetical protein
MRAKILGYILFFAGLFIQLYLIFRLHNYEFNITSVVNMLSGVLLIFSPQTFINLVERYLSRKKDQE